MCAICGVIGVVISKEAETTMLESMKHRGPDENGNYHGDECLLLHTRLAIVDPAGGTQPMHLDWEGAHYILIYNGELYNTAQLRDELEAFGHRFATHSDTEVVLHAFAQWKQGCTEKFNGIFAFAVWETTNRRLFLARDRIGVKPLFFVCRNHTIYFASEMKTLLCSPNIRAELDQDGVYQLLLLGPGRRPGSGVFRGIEELQPGCWAFFDNGKLNISRYWKLQDREHTESFEETVDHVRYLVMDSIQRQMISDVPIGAFLSGGLDSSIICAVCAKNVFPERLRTFSVDYVNNDLYFRPGKFQPNSDSYYIDIMKTHLNSNHTGCFLNSEDLEKELENATIARDLPGMADVDFSLLAFSRIVSKEAKMVLSGECADEIFGGYPWYRDPQIRAQEGFPWSQTTKQRTVLLRSGKKDAADFVMDLYRDTCNSSDVLPSASYTERRMKELMNLNFGWFMQTLLDRKDRMSMFCGLEVRVPFCDYRIAEYLYSVPWEYKEYEGREKGLLRYAMRDLLPEEICFRKKSPYPKTFDPAYEQIVRRRLLELLETESPLFEFVDKTALHSMLTAESEWPWYGQLMRRPQTIAYFLQIDFWLKHYKVQLVF